MQSAALLTFDGTIDCVNSAKDATHCRGISTKSVVRAGVLRLGTIWTPAAIAHPKEMPEGQQDQGLKAIRARERISRQQGLALLVAWQLLMHALIRRKPLGPIRWHLFVVASPSKFRTGTGTRRLKGIAFLSGCLLHPRPRSSVRASGESRKYSTSSSGLLLLWNLALPS